LITNRSTLAVGVIPTERSKGVKIEPQRGKSG
jgi:Methyltransferase domain